MEKKMKTTVRYPRTTNRETVPMPNAGEKAEKLHLTSTPVKDRQSMVWAFLTNWQELGQEDHVSSGVYNYCDGQT